MRYVYFVLIGLLTMVVFFLPPVSSQITDENFPAKMEKEEKTVAVRAGDRGKPRVNFEDGRDLSGANSSNQNHASARLAVSADFDSDGTADLITADTAGNLKFYRGNVDSIYPNSREANARKASGGFTGEAFLDSAKSFQISISPDFLAAGDLNADGRADLLAARKGDERVHFLQGDGAGNFASGFQIPVGGAITALAIGEIGRQDGQADAAIAVSNNEGNRLLVFEHPEGAFKHQPEIVKLPSPADVLAIGNLDADYFADVAVAGGDLLTVVRGRGQAYPWDLLEKYGIKRPASIVETRSLPFEIAALATGNFTEKRGEGLAILTTAGSLLTLDSPETEKRISQPANLKNAETFLPSNANTRRFAAIKTRTSGNSENPDLLPVNRADREKYLSEQREKAASESEKLSEEAKTNLMAESAEFSKQEIELARTNFLQAISPAEAAPLAQWKIQTLLTDARLTSAAFSSNAEKIFKVRVSDSGKDELAFLDQNAGKIHLLARGKTVQGITAADEIVSFEVASSPTAILPMHLNRDALSDLVVLREGSATPSVVMTAPAATFVVNSTGIAPVCTQSQCTLRGAINEANDNPGADLIIFNIGGGGVQTILPENELPEIHGAVTIDGTTQPGFSGEPLIEIKGTNTVGVSDGLQINAANVVVRGLAINEFKGEFNPELGSNVGGNGISIFNYVGEIHAGNAIIEGNYLGTDPTGMLDKGNDFTGVNIYDSDNNRVGGTTPAARNILSGSGTNNDPNIQPRKVGVGLSVVDGKNTRIKGNYIGTNAAGTQRVNNSYGVFFGASNSEFGGDEAGAGNVVSGNGDPFPAPGDPNRCFGPGISEETILDGVTGELLTFNNNYKGNRIGTNAAGDAALRNCGTGLTVKPMHTANIGSITENGRNTISGNGEGALYCSPVPRGFELGGGELPEGFCNIAGNNVGTNVAGNAAIPNTDNGGGASFIIFFGTLVVYNADTFSNIGAPGGTSPDACTGFCNLVSGNDQNEGIHRGSREGLVGVFNNYIGTNKTGTAAVPNSFGVNVIFAGLTAVGGVGVLEGGGEVSLGNLISGNLGSAVSLDGPSGGTIYEYAVEGNLIGTDKTGTTAVPNDSDPDFANSAIRIGEGRMIPTIGGTHPLSRNVIAGNGGTGVFIGGAFFPLVVNNYIGVNKQGQPLGNGADGVWVYSDNASIGGNSEAEGNVIANNGRAGVLVSNQVNFNGSIIRHRNNSIRFNSIYNNAVLGIDLSNDSTLPVTPDGVTANDCGDFDDGANNLQNYPVLTAPVLNGNGTVSVEGAFKGRPQTSLVVDFYANASADPTNYGEGQTYIGSKNIRTDSEGFTTFLFTSTEAVAPNLKITATATDAAGNTSEFSCFAGQCEGELRGLTDDEKRRRLGEQQGCLAPWVIIVTVDTDQPDPSPNNAVCDVDLVAAGLQCSLRAAIQTSEGSAHPGHNIINFNIPGGGIKTITPTTALPSITQELIIDATTQPGYSNSPVVQVSGNAAISYGLHFAAGSNDSGVYGLAINRFFAGIGFNSSENRVEKCYIGLNADGTPAGTPGQQQIGIDLRTSGATGNRIGGLEDTGNVISNNGIGVAISQSANSNKVLGNKIGTNPAGTAAAPNNFGVVIETSRDNTIGDIVSEDGNLISGNSAFGVILSTDASNNRVINNTIGTKANGTEVLPNGETGIFVTNEATGNFIEKNAIGGHNLTEGGAGIGFAANAGPGNSVTENFIGVVRDGTAAIPNKYGIVNTSDGQIIGSQNGGNIIGHNEKAGIWITPFAGEVNPVVENNLVQYNLVGTNGTADIGNPEIGIWVSGDAQNNRVERNVVSGNDAFGIVVADGASLNRISLNLVGTDTSGNSAVANGGGIWIRQATANQIESNLVSGNSLGILVGTNFGIEAFSTFIENYKAGSSRKNLGGMYTSGNQISGNTVGLNAARNSAIPNSIGIAVGENARNNFIGSTGGAYNLISGNTATIGYGVLLGTLAANPAEDSLPQFNTFQGNVIGLAGNLQSTIPNKIGFVLLQAARNTIGGETDLLANTIVASTEDGIQITDGSRENTILKNYLGVLPPGFGSPLNKQSALSPDGVNYGNGGDGILIKNGAQQNIIGGTTSGSVIANNDGNGITLAANAGTGNLIGKNNIFGNSGLGVDIGDDGHTPNDPTDADTGPNKRQNYPEIVSRQITGGDLIVNFKVDSAPANSNYGANGINVEFFKADASGEGEKFLGFAFYTVADYNNGSPLTKSINLGNAAALGFGAGDRLVATATDADGNSSEFTPALAPTAANVTVSGRILSANERGIFNARISITDVNGETRTVLSNSFGYYRFTDVEAGQTYIISVAHKRHYFEPPTRAVTVTEELTDVDFRASP